MYNEEQTILQLVQSVENVILPNNMEKEIIIIDDCSTDRTREILSKIDMKNVKIILHEKNKGKGGALKTGFKNATGDFVIIQDADLEYEPNEYPKLLYPLLQNKADVVFGSRFLGGEPHRVLYYWHTLTNQFLTFCSNLFSDLNLTDMETCYKVFRKEILDLITLEEDKFGIEPEITAKIGTLARERNIRVYEVGISYYGRTYNEGKKIKMKDAFRALWCIFAYNTSWFAHLVKYIIFGVIVAISQFATMWILIEWLGFQSQDQQNIANILSIALALFVAFIIHSYITWRYIFSSTGELILKLVEFYIISLISFIPRVFLFDYLANQGMEYVLNTIIGIIFAICVNFLGYDKIVFKKSSTRGFGLLEQFLANKRIDNASKYITKKDRCGRILDIGCGPNPQFLESIQFAEKYGIDSAIDEGTQARFKYVMHLFNSDLSNLDTNIFSNLNFDIISMLAVVEHLPTTDLQNLLLKLYNLLKPEGKIIITTPSARAKGLLNLMAKFRLVSPTEIEDHKAYYDIPTLTGILQDICPDKSKIKSGTFECGLNLYFIVSK